VINVNSFGEHLVKLEINRFRKKLAGVGGGKYLSPREKVEEAERVLETLNKMRREHRNEDRFFASEAFKRIENWLKEFLQNPQNQERLHAGGMK
jgi:hypothetical protein